MLFAWLATTETNIKYLISVITADNISSGFAGADLANSTNPQVFAEPMGNANDEAGSGEIYIFNPSSTTFVKHFSARFNHNSYAGKIEDYYTAGYCNTTSAVTGIRFEMEASTNIQSGVFKLYGIKDS